MRAVTEKQRTQPLQGQPKKSKKRIDWRLFGQRVAAFFVFALIWEGVIRTGVLPSITLGVIDIVIAIFSILGAASFWAALWNTLIASGVGWLIATGVGVLFGLLIGTMRLLDRS